MSEEFAVQQTKESDLDFIISLFQSAMDYQRKKGYPVWAGYDRSVILRDMNLGNHYKIVIENEIAIVFSVQDSDPLIWRGRDKGDAIYLHRVVVNPKFKGRKLFGNVLEWTIEHAKQKRLSFVRMDTWGDNPNMIDYYKSFGFEFIENYLTPDSEELPVQNRNLILALLELKARS